MTRHHGDRRRRHHPGRPARTTPARAWLQPTQDRDRWLPGGRTADTWSMFVEETRENLDGPFDILVMAARSLGVKELHVWSRTRLVFEPFDPRTTY
ncbi:MAG: hypothetical protein HOQ22_10610 [Nocardioidaceae bacterium]|nr:hypothetical protein [Nocardioidaceae bacterium]NUS51477.1 hypothetical protein [Nocardioidaceae bacterium]